ncbi:hypothetical protein E2C01_094879 [Portunus trituberculatus]|uniref:Uncharacterized protein n=1 Tax=Portunus trituberculatus TaxID=210409 RepID=A0A5B7JY28_PORTR|nr:hypothetical protein [Portunus trituberculatus]
MKLRSKIQKKDCISSHCVHIPLNLESPDLTNTFHLSGFGWRPVRFFFSCSFVAPIRCTSTTHSFMAGIID